jgi:hypothetical protein
MEMPGGSSRSLTRRITINYSAVATADLPTFPALPCRVKLSLGGGVVAPTGTAVRGTRMWIGWGGHAAFGFAPDGADG